ncbi:MAG: hypothetical protein CVU56_23285 [Deltaproteobacteria bacterium HGW-Deltaproteobacteria-14]|jgi:Spy/CpxP family protein refolding chaperone|nr:MAG: hypothetical protein CVU56_23285 [Deltaproteobacteria bacterium HGW-Deltaproteobacteria-14]
MTRRSIITSGIVALVALALAAPAAFSRGPEGPNGGFGQGRGERGARFTKALDLSPEQVTAFKALREEQQADAQATRQELKTKRQAIRAQWQSGSPDRATILALTAEINALQAQKAADRVDFMFAAKGLLTPEQFTKFTALQGKRGGPGMRGGKGGGGERGFHARGGKRGDRDGKRGRFGERGGQFQGPQAPEVDAE